MRGTIAVTHSREEDIVAVTQIKNRISKPFIKNSKVPLSMNLGGKVRSGHVIVSGTVVVSGGTTSGVKVGPGAPAGLLRRIIVTATPSANSRYPGGRIVNCDAWSLLLDGIFRHSGKFVAELRGSTLGDGAAGTYDVYFSVPIYWADSTMRPSYASSLNTDDGVYDSVQISVETADLANCFTGNDRDVDYTALNVMWVDDKINMPGDTLVRYIEDHDFIIASTRDRAIDEAMERDGSYESWLFISKQSAAQTLSDDLFRKLLLDGPTVGVEMWADDIRQRMIDDEWVDPAQDVTGLHYFDFTDGVFQNTIDARTLTTRLDVTNVSGANLDTITVMTRRVVAPVPAGK